MEHVISAGSASSARQLSNEITSSLFKLILYAFTTTTIASDETTADTWALDPNLHLAKPAMFASIFGFKWSFNASKSVEEMRIICKASGEQAQL